MNSFWLQMNIANAQKKNVQFLSGDTVTIVYADEHEFNG